MGGGRWVSGDRRRRKLLFVIQVNLESNVSLPCGAGTVAMLVHLDLILMKD